MSTGKHYDIEVVEVDGESIITRDAAQADGTP